MNRLRAACLAALWAAAGCRAVLPPTSLALSLPPVPRAWTAAFGEIDVEVRYTDAAGSRVAADASPWREGPAEIILELEPRLYSPVVVTPVPKGLGVALRPAGAVFPLDASADGSLLQASWEHGPAALLLERLLVGAAAGSAAPEELDVQLLVRDMERTGAGNPWRVDADTLAATIAARGGKDWQCRRLPEGSIRIPAAELPARASAGAYAWDNPLAPVAELVEAEDGTLLLEVEAVPVGFHRLFPLPPGDATGWLDIEVTAQEAVWIARLPVRQATPEARPP